MNSINIKKYKGKTGQEIQEEIFRKMPASRKLKLASELTILCLKLRNLNENSKPRKTTDPNGIYS